MKLRWTSYNLQLKYPFTISSYSRTATPVILTQIEYDGLVGYGEASLPQYLGATQESVIDFLSKVELSQFSDPTKIDDILFYVDSIDLGNTAAKASVDIALHDLVGKIWNKSWFQIWNLNPTKKPYSTFTIGIDTDEIVKKKTLEVATSFKYLKVKLGSDNDKHLIETIQSVTNLP